MTAIVTPADSFGTKFTVCLRPKGDGTKAGAITSLTPSDAEQIAIALSEVLRESDRLNGRPPRPRLITDWVEVAKEPEAGVYTVTVVNQDVMARVIPYTDPIGPVRFSDPMFAGRRLDGRPHLLQINRHGQLIGGTEWGKSSLMQCAIAFATKCAEQNRDVLVWICGVQKLYDLVAGWVEPFLNKGLRCPIDWIAQGPEDSLEMLAAAMRVGRYRQSTRMGTRGNWPAILLVLDEVSFLLEKHVKPILFDGVPMHADTMLTDIVRGVTSAKVYAMLATQHDVHAVFGDKGNTLQAQMAYSAMFRINDDSAHGRQLGDYKLQMPRCKGEYWIRDETTGIPVRVKAPYPQTVDPDKPILHDGLTVADIAWSRRGMHTGTPHELDERSAIAAGPAYRNRTTLVTEEFLDYLMGVTPSPITISRPMDEPEVVAEESEAVSSEQRELTAANADFAKSLRELRNLGEELPEEMADWLAAYELEHPSAPAQSTSPGPVASVSSMVGRKPRIDRIEEIVRARGPLTRSQVLAELEKQGDRITNPQLVTNDLARLVQRSRLFRDDEGYRAL